MRSNCSLYVDAGYLLAAAATRVTGTSLRKGIHVEYGNLVSEMLAQATELSGLPALRVHWYDSAKNGVPDAQQERIGELPKVKLRLGRFGMDGQQKGVDLRIGLDLVAHARNDAADVCFLVSGDDDLTEAVEEAQGHGVEVVVLAVPNAQGKPHAVSRHLVRAADDLALIDASVVDRHVIRVEIPAEPEPEPEPVAPPPAVEQTTPTEHHPSPADLAALAKRAQSTPIPAPAAHIPTQPPSVAYSGTTGQESQITPGYGGESEAAVDEAIDVVVERLVRSFRSSATGDALAELEGARPSIPRDIDRALLLDLSDVLEVYDLNDQIRFRLRARFWDTYDRIAE